MLDEIFDQISKAVLYQGYLLYEQRLNGNSHKLNVGTLVPRLSGDTENWEMRTECLVKGTEQSVIDVRCRFFGLQGGDAVEERMNVPRSTLGTLTDKSKQFEFAFFPERKIFANIEIAAARLAEGLFKITVRVQNLSSPKNSGQISLEEIMRHSMFALHTCLHLEAGEFVSLLNPPEEFREMVSHFNNLGTQPVLHGKNGEQMTMLSSPFVRRDYPEVVVENTDETRLRLHPDWR